MEPGLDVLGGRTAAAFLDAYWQKRPLVVRGAVDPDALRLTPSGLQQLARAGKAPARLVCAPRADRGWRMRTGPFTADDFESLPSTGWTLLVQEVDRHHDDAAALLERFRFVPNWRLDDVMVSHATDGGGVGPHVDRYDVFLIQAAGRRRWRVGSEPLDDPALDPQAAVPILASFQPDEEWILEPGDLLYLPPRLPHEGVALGPCVTCSVGFRAPDPRELCAGFFRGLPPSAFEAVRYADPDLRPPHRPGEVSAEARRRLRTALETLLADTDRFDRWLGDLLTRPLRPREAMESDRLVAARGVWDALAEGAVLRRSSPADFAWLQQTDDEILLFVGGESYALGPDGAGVAEVLCGTATLSLDALHACASQPTLRQIVMDLVLRGYLDVRRPPFS